MFENGNKLGGRKKLSDDVREARNMSHEEMIRTVVDIGDTPIEKLKEIIDDPLTKSRVRVIATAYATSDFKAIKYYEDRLWGRAVENIDLDVGGGFEVVYIDKCLKDV